MSDKTPISVSAAIDSLMRAASAEAARAVLQCPSTTEQTEAIDTAVTAAVDAAMLVIQPYLDAIDAGLESDSFELADGTTVTIAHGIITEITPPEEV